MLHITFSKYDCTIIYQVWVYFHCISITLKSLQNHNYNYMTSCIGVLMLHITFSKYDCIIVHKAYYLLTCTCVSINSFHSHSHSHSHSIPNLNTSIRKTIYNWFVCGIREPRRR